jgi:cell division protein FtsQ
MSRRWQARRFSALGFWRWAFSVIATPVRAGFVFVWRRRRLRILLLCALLALPPLLGGWLWLRSSSLVSVQRVRISGVRGPDAEAIEAALAGAARHMTTLDIHAATLRAAVAPFRVVRELQTTSSFPHGLDIRVVEQLPVAVLTVGGQRTAVAADGVVLGPTLLSSSLPTLTGAFEPSAGQHVRSPSLLAALTVLGAAPAPLMKVVARVFWGSEGLTVVMRNGLLSYFGDATRPHAKWLALASVLVDPSSAGASYVDVRLPERPAAGFAGGTAPIASAAAEPDSASDPGTAAELAAGLSAAVVGGSPTGSAASDEQARNGATSGEATSTGPAEASPTATPEATPDASSETAPAAAPQTPTVTHLPPG